MVGPWPWTFGGFLWGVPRFLEPLAPSNQQQHGSQRLRTRPQSSISLLCLPSSRRALSFLTSFEGSLPRVSRWPRSWHSRELHGGRDRGILAWQPNQFAPAAGRGVPVCSTSRGQPPTWCDLWRCREMIIKLHFEGVWRDIPASTPQYGHQPHNWKRGVSEDIPGGGCPRIFT